MGVGVGGGRKEEKAELALSMTHQAQHARRLSLSDWHSVSAQLMSQIEAETSAFILTVLPRGKRFKGLFLVIPGELF